tara:strand:+ start:204 stop:332 length:129 start_codon:yes stop_codon:yes gene_type:complete
LDAKVQFDGAPMPGGFKATPIQQNLDFAGGRDNWPTRRDGRQ